MNLLTAAQMRSIERSAIDSGQVTGLELMERAGRCVVDAVFAEWPVLATTSHRAVVLCGPGNNGGDGYVIARMLLGWGWRVDVFGMGARDTMPPDARANRTKWEALGLVLPLEQAQFDGADLIVDAIFGIGLSRGFTPPPNVGAAFHDLFAGGFRGHHNMVAPYVVAVDSPSGLDADSGVVLVSDGDWAGEIRAHLTVTFHRPKCGHVLADGPEVCGKLVVADIGLREDGQGVATTRSPNPMLAEPSLSKGVGHKYSYGHALVLSGPIARSGAARLAARGAIRIGAGLVTLAVPGSALLECASKLTAIMARKCNGPKELADLLEDRRFNAICLGPGLGVGQSTRGLVATALGSARSVVLDADALSSYAADPQGLFSMLHQGTVLTPHEGEFARLFPDIAARIGINHYSKIDATKDAAARANCTILYKGPDTVIASPDGRVSVHGAVYDRTAPWLATAGSGDVLAGFTTGLLARGFDPQRAAEVGAYLHVEAARAFGPGLIAEDLPEILPQVLREILEGPNK